MEDINEVGGGGVDQVANHNDNPFRVPSDEEVFMVRDKEKQDALEARKRFNGLKIWEKSSKPARSSTQLTRTLRPNRNGLDDKAHFLGERRREKENMADFIAKKREIFLVQMSLDTKREEIRNLEEKAKMKEEALRKSELMLEADAIRFDKFLKENDRNAHEAIKRHDDESKAKQEKVAEIKKLNHEIAKVQSEMSKYAEQLEDCLKYKEFLDGLTPAAEKEALLAQHRAKIEERKMRKAGVESAVMPKKSAEDAAVAGGEGALEAAENVVEEDGHDEEVDEEEDEVEPIYFKEPHQLLDIFSALEERNLFLIQNSQETEEALEELKKKYEDTQVQMRHKSAALTANIDDLQQKIAKENEKVSRLEQRVSSNVGVGKQEEMLHELGTKVTEVYSRCGFNPDANPDTLDKLAEIERKLESLIKVMAELPADYVRAAEKKKEGERRDRLRKQKVLEKQRAYEERLAKSVARATAAIPQKSGKKVMFRSPPLQRKKKASTNDDQHRLEEEIRFKKFFT